jgi:hypothetical protein
METASGIDWTWLLNAFLLVIGLSLVLALLLLAYILVQVRRIHLPPNADFFTALRYTPVSVVIFLDLLDLGLDFFSAPISWILLGKLGLAPLRGVTVVEDLIPGTQFIPTMTLAWVFARVTRPWIPSTPSGYRQRYKQIDQP